MDQNSQTNTLRILPVLDLRQGIAVHATGGTRALYRPLRSILHDSPDPLSLALALRDRLGLVEVYLADLDAIEGGEPNLDILRTLRSQGFHPWVDAGLRDASGIDRLRHAGASTVIAATETLDGARSLTEIGACQGLGSLVFGLDLRDGRPIVKPGSSWPSLDAMGLIDEALKCGIRRVLILDLGRVGSGRGVGTTALAVELKRRVPGVEISLGGGVRGPDDLWALADLGISSVLVGSALHDGRIVPAARGER